MFQVYIQNSNACAGADYCNVIVSIHTVDSLSSGGSIADDEMLT